MQGRLDDAMEAARMSLRTAEALGERVIAVMARILMAGSAVLRGDDDAADEHSSAADGWARASGNPLLTGMAAMSRGVRCYANGDLEHARAALVEAIPALLAGGLWTPRADEWLADVSLRAGDVAAAREHAAHAAAVVEQSGNDWGRSHAALAKCRVDLHEGKVDDATHAAHLALELAGHTEDALTTIDTLELLATIAAQRRSPVTAVRLLGAAGAARSSIGYARLKLHIADHVSVVRDLEAALGVAEFTRVWDEGERLSLADAVALARTRRGSRRRPTTGWDALTPAELRVVKLVGKGLNNVQIAERLFVTRETVKGHVSVALRKLGVTNRVELAAEAARRAGHSSAS
jgi:DNA-binding NarL/FixJ family response regulator